MDKMEQGSLCPKCGGGQVHRIRRRPWMRRFPQSKYYHCTGCRARFLTVYGWAVRLPNKPPTEDT